MQIDFKDLNVVAEQNYNSTLSDVLAARMSQYQDVKPEEVLDLLEEASEPYAILSSALSHHLQKVAREEIKFFRLLYLKSLIKSLLACRK